MWTRSGKVLLIYSFFVGYRHSNVIFWSSGRICTVVGQTDSNRVESIRQDESNLRFSIRCSLLSVTDYRRIPTVNCVCAPFLTEFLFRFSFTRSLSASSALFKLYIIAEYKGIQNSIEAPFAVWTWGDPRNHLLGGKLNPQGGGCNFFFGGGHLPAHCKV